MKRTLILFASLGLLVACDELQTKDKPKEPDPAAPHSPPLRPDCKVGRKSRRRHCHWPDVQNMGLGLHESGILQQLHEGMGRKFELRSQLLGSCKHADL
jgi:hypothetical protein